MLPRRRLWTSALVLLLAGLASAPPAAGLEARVAASLEGRSIDVADAAKYHCHDLAFPKLECYQSAAVRDDAAATIMAGGVDKSTDALIASSNGYVVAYLHATYAGSSVVLSQDYSNLGTIGWNDTISSYKVYTNLMGYFWEHIYFGGRRKSFCCFTNVAWVGDLYNDTFSSFDLP